MTKKELRYYQRDAIRAIIASLRADNTPCASISTGGGKSLVAADLSDKTLKQGRRVLQLVPTMELCKQNFTELFEYTDYKQELGVCCSKLGKYQVNKKAVIATHTSFLSRRTKAGAFDLLICDECHLVSPEEQSTYQKIIRSLKRLNPNMKIVGLTATPYRSHGMIHEDSLKGKATFNHLCYESDIAQLISDGYLSHVESISGDVSIDLTGVGTVGGDYDTKKMGVKFGEICADAVADMRVKFAAYDIKTALVFCSTLENARAVLDCWGDKSTMRIVYGDMTKPDRDSAIQWLKNGHGTRIIVNVGVLTTGFDFSALDCVVLLRATKSLGLYIQMVGRVIRAHTDKERGYLLDYGTNIERHGSIDKTILPKTKKRAGEAPQKFCKVDSGGCGALNLAAAKKCKECGAEFISEDERGNYSMRSKAAALALTVQRFDIVQVDFSQQISKNTGDAMIKMEFYDEISLMVEDGYQKPVHSAFMCLDHGGQAANIARSMLKGMMIEPKQYYTLKNEELSVESILYLLQNHYADFFKTITKIAIWDNKDNPKYKDFKILEYDR